MKKANSILGIIASLVIGAAILVAGSQSSISVFGLPLFFVCGAIGFALHWTISFCPPSLFKLNITLI
jgi:hypothetical protein